MREVSLLIWQLMGFDLHLLNFSFVLVWVGMDTTLRDPRCARQRADQQLSQEAAAGRFVLEHQQKTRLFRPCKINKEELLLPLSPSGCRG